MTLVHFESRHVREPEYRVTHYEVAVEEGGVRVGLNLLHDDPRLETIWRQVEAHVSKNSWWNKIYPERDLLEYQDTPLTEGEIAEAKRLAEERDCELAAFTKSYADKPTITTAFRFVPKYLPLVLDPPIAL